MCVKSERVSVMTAHTDSKWRYSRGGWVSAIRCWAWSSPACRKPEWTSVACRDPCPRPASWCRTLHPDIPPAPPSCIPSPRARPHPLEAAHKHNRIVKRLPAVELFNSTSFGLCFHVLHDNNSSNSQCEDRGPDRSCKSPTVVYRSSTCPTCS